MINENSDAAQSDGSEQSNSFFDNAFRTRKIMGILRGLSPSATVDLCYKAWDIGIELVEIPIPNSASLASLRAAGEVAKKEGHFIGAGTVTRSSQLEAARAAGASFTVAPGFDGAIASEALELGLAHLAGVATATEIQLASNLGLRWFKAFPAKQLSSGWIAAMLAPFPDANFVAVGGIDASNAQTFLDAGARAVAVGTALKDPSQAARFRELNGPRPALTSDTEDSAPTNDE
jgi:2-dehydro-3-deoxyphosphogluconate aldolase/(4S)-4-hydroxy-2-oxoglutarate aldolase